MTTERSTHQLVGVVTKMFPTFGYINNEIFFQRKCVIGPMVEVGDNVATSAIYQPNMPIRWSAEKVWRVQGTVRHRSKDDPDESKRWKDKSPRRISPVGLSEVKRSSDRDSRASRVKESVVHNDRKRDRTYRLRSPVKRSSLELVESKRRRLSPTVHKSPQRSEGLLQTSSPPMYLLNTKNMVFHELHSRYPDVLAPVDLYRVICNWQDSFPLLQPFNPDRSTVFQILSDAESAKSSIASSVDDGVFVNVLLLSMPSITSLQDKTISRAESTSRGRASLRKQIKLLTVSKSKQLAKGIGGAWNSKLDGAEPLTNPQALINAAIRMCKEQIGLDLSYCTHWHRFLEFRYSRTEGSTARPTSVLFPGSQLWGRSFRDESVSKSPSAMKPYHRIVVYFIPDTWTLMPSPEKWNDVRKAVLREFSRPGSHLFPLPYNEFSQKQKETTDAMDATSAGSGSSNKKESKTSVTKHDRISSETIELEATKLKTECHLTVAEPLLDSIQMNEDSLRSPTSVITGKDMDSTVHESNEAGKILKKPHDEIILSSMKVSELREQLKVRNLPADGIKAQLLSRLKTSIEKEAEEAKKLEQERKKKEKEQQDEIAAKVADDSNLTQHPNPEPVCLPSVDIKITLEDHCSIIVQNKLPSDYALQVVSLDSIISAKFGSIDAQSYELILCAHNLLDMFRRDSIFTLFRALVTAGDRGVQAKHRPMGQPNVKERNQLDIRDRAAVDKATPAKLSFQTVDVPLLFACSYLDPHDKQYFFADEAENMILTLGLPTSRYQVRCLIAKVVDGRRIFYRTLTDAEVTTSSIKSATLFSEIDDDEYLLELIRGGDAILDESKGSEVPVGSVLVLRDQNIDQAVDVSLTSDLLTPTPNVFTSHMRRMEAENARIKAQLQLKVNDIERLRKMTDQISTLKAKLLATENTVNEYRRRLRVERDQMHSACRILNQQVNSLETSRTSLRQALSRLRGSDGEVTPKKANSESKSRQSDPSIKSPARKLSPKRKQDTIESVQTTEIVEPTELTQPTEDATDQLETVSDPADCLEESSLKCFSISVVPLASSEMINGTTECNESFEDVFTPIKLDDPDTQLVSDSA